MTNTIIREIGIDECDLVIDTFDQMHNAVDLSLNNSRVTWAVPVDAVDQSH
jgi:hypothetical protein